MSSTSSWIFSTKMKSLKTVKIKWWGMLLGIPYSQFTVRKHENIHRGHESFLQSWPILSDPTVVYSNQLPSFENVFKITHFRYTFKEHSTIKNWLKIYHWDTNLFCHFLSKTNKQLVKVTNLKSIYFRKYFKMAFISSTLNI